MRFMVALLVLLAGCGEAPRSFGGMGGAAETGGAPGTGGVVGSGGASLATGGASQPAGGSSQATGGSSFGGAGGAFVPGGVTRIWPVGDSITAGAVEDAALHADYSGGGWRAPLFAALVRAGMQVDFVGSVPNTGPFALAPGLAAGTAHDGHSGVAAAGVRKADLLHAWLPAVPPDVVLLSLGANDYNTVADGMNVGWLIDRVRELVPAATIFVATLAPQGRELDVINGQIKAEVAARPGVRLVDMTQAGLVLDEPTVSHGDYSGAVYGNLHPSAQGYAKMAAHWERALLGSVGGDPECAGKAEGAECRAPACGGPTAQIGGPAGSTYPTQAIYYACRASKCVSVTRDCTGALTCANGTTQACGAKGFCYNPADRNTCACYNGPDQVPLCR